ncbi:hypothetical protein Bca101_089183 [Brassica carinata]
MALVATKFTEMPLRSSLPLTSTSRYHSSPSLHALLFDSLSAAKPSRRVLRPFSSLRTSERSSNNGSRNNRRLDHRNSKPNPPWIDKWPPLSSAAKKSNEHNGGGEIPSAEAKLRYVEKDRGQSAIEKIVLRLRNLGLASDEEEDAEDNGGDVKAVTGEERLGDLLKREWVKPDVILAEGEEESEVEDDDVLLPWEKKNEEEHAAERIEGDGVVALKKRRVRAPSLAELTMCLSAGDEARHAKDYQNAPPEIKDPIVKNPIRKEGMTEEEAEFNSLLDSLGPRFHEWWGTGVLPVNADLLPPTILGYKTPFRLLPTGMRSNLTNAEMTNLRKIGRNRNHQGLAAAILKLWEKSLIAKIAVKRGIQNTNNKLMSDEIKTLTGGVLLLRNKYYIVIYRGKDFLPSSVAATLAERQELTKEIQDVEEKVRIRDIEATQPVGEKVLAEAGTLAEFYEAQARWGKEITPDHREKMIEEASRIASARVVKRIQHKLDLSQSKFDRAEKLLSKIEASMIPNGPDYDQEVISEEERIMFRKVGLKMKSYLPLGIRGVFDGVIENMHLHWKHRELVKLISKQKSFAFVEDTARLLEYESGGVLVAIEKVPKGFALIYYRGKNYQRPVSLRPRNLLTKAKALKRSIAIQRHEALSQHISELEKTIEQMQNELVSGLASSTTAKNPSYNESEWENDDDDDGEEEKDDESDWD